MSTAPVRIRDIEFNRTATGDDFIAWHDGENLLGPDQGGTDDGNILIRFNVDSQHDNVTADLKQAGDLEALDRAIETLTLIRGRLHDLYGDSDRMIAGCLARSVTSRCRRTGVHDHHDFGAVHG